MKQFSPQNEIPKILSAIDHWKTFETGPNYFYVLICNLNSEWSFSCLHHFTSKSNVIFKKNRLNIQQTENVLNLSCRIQWVVYEEEKWKKYIVAFWR
jgi:hypothetical protein